MRLWSLHPYYLDSKGLVAVWREALLAQKVLLGQTKGYKNHPQLWRFKNSSYPLAAIAYYLAVIQQEATQRHYQFDKTKILSEDINEDIIEQIPVTDQQINYEWQHLQAKLAIRDMVRYHAHQIVITPKQHPLFTVIVGEIEQWEKRVV